MSTPKKGPDATIGGRIAMARFHLAARQGKTVTQAWLAQQTGVSGPTVSQWESGITEPSLASVAKIAAALGVSPGWIAWGITDAKIPASPSAGSVEPDPDLDYKFTDEDRARDEAVVAARKSAKAAKHPRKRA